MTEYRYDPISFPGPALPESCYRALHSYFLDAVFQMSEAQRDDIVRACDGFPSFHRFMLSVFRRQLHVDTIPEQETGIPWLWIHYPRHDRLMAWPIVAVDSINVGADPELLAIELDIRLQGALDGIVALGEAE